MSSDRLFDPETARNRWPVYDELRPDCPLQIGRRTWVVLSHDHARRVLGDPGTFSSDVRDLGNPVYRDSPLVFDDPPRHTALRRLVTVALTPRRVSELEPWIRSTAAGLIEGLVPGPTDFVATVADPLPVLVIARLLGVPAEEHRQLKQWSDDRGYVTYHGGRDAPRTPELEAAEAGCEAMYARFRELLAERRRAPRDDLLTALSSAEVDGTRLSEREVVGIASVLLTAGNLTTTRLLSNLAHLLATNPELRARASADPAVVPAIVEESLRRDSPLQFPVRRAATDAPLGSATIPAGHTVMVGIGPANRDPAAHHEPDRVVLDRAEGHLAFGHGIHFCAGAALARLEARVTVELLTRNGLQLALAADPVPEAAIAHCGFERLDVTLR